MRIAVFADVHSNIAALQAVYADLLTRQVDRIYCAGDLVGYAPFPNEVIEFIKTKGISTVMGNYDDGVGNQRLICGCEYQDEQAHRLGEISIGWTKEHTTEENKSFLRALPEALRFQVGHHKVLIVHGSPRALNEYLTEYFPEAELEQIFKQNDTNVLICGHTHRPYHKQLGSNHIINVGSIGKPKHGTPSSVYALLELDQEVKVEFVKVNYNYETIAKAIEASALPDEFADLIRKGVG